MGQTYLPIGTQVKFDTQTYRVISYAGQGGAGLVYCAVNVDESIGNKIAIRETFPSEGAIRLPNGDIVSTEQDGITSDIIGRYQERVKKALKNAAIAEGTTFRVIIPFPDLYGPERPAYICLPGSEEFEVSKNQYVLMSDATLTGLPLRAYIEAYKASHDGNLPLRQIVDIMLSVCEVVKHLHNGDEDGKRLLHGDISYGNIFLSDCDPVAGNCGIARLLDFGESRELKVNGGRLETAEIGINDPLGSTTGFMPPEIYYRKDSLKLTAAVDTYALGYLLLSLAKSINVIEPNYLYSRHYLKRIANSDRERLTASKSAQILLNRIIDKALQNDNNQRYQNGQELLEDIQHLDDVVGINEEPKCEHGLTSNVCWRFVEKHLENNNSQFEFQHHSTIARNLPPKRMPLMVQDSYGKTQTIDSLWDDITSSKASRSLSITAPGGFGKTFSVSLLIRMLFQKRTAIPFYLDLSGSDHVAPEEKADPSQSLLGKMISAKYFLGNKRLAEDITVFLKSSNPADVIVVLDNCHVRATAAPAFWEDILQDLHSLGCNYVLCGRSGLSLPEKLSASIQIEAYTITGLEFEQCIQELEAVLKRALCSEERRMLLHQKGFLSSPMFFMRYLEMIDCTAGEVIPQLGAQILLDYFMFRLKSCPFPIHHGTFDFHQANTLFYTYLPLLARYYSKLPDSEYEVTAEYERETSKEYAALINATQLHPTIKFIRKRETFNTSEQIFNECHIGKSPEEAGFILNCAVQSGAMNECNGHYSFAHDVYVDFFFGLFIVKSLTDCAHYHYIEALQPLCFGSWPQGALVYWPFLLENVYDNVFGTSFSGESVLASVKSKLFESEHLFKKFWLVAEQIAESLIDHKSGYSIFADEWIQACIEHHTPNIAESIASELYNSIPQNKITEVVNTLLSMNIPPSWKSLSDINKKRKRTDSTNEWKLIKAIQLYWMTSREQWIPEELGSLMFPNHTERLSLSCLYDGMYASSKEKAIMRMQQCVDSGEYDVVFMGLICKLIAEDFLQIGPPEYSK